MMRQPGHDPRLAPPPAIALMQKLMQKVTKSTRPLV
jgi:hypothetical protein